MYIEASSSRRSRGDSPTRSISGTSSPKESTSRTRRSASRAVTSIWADSPGSASGSGEPVAPESHASNRGPSPAGRPSRERASTTNFAGMYSRLTNTHAVPTGTKNAMLAVNSMKP